jgi:GDPmannose 4,6-dehydratase
MKTALITGFTGQDGTFLTKLLIDKGYTVIGLVRRISTEPPHRVRGKFDFSKEIAAGQVILEIGDLNSIDSLIKIFKKHKIDEVYNLAAQSDVGLSFTLPELTAEINYLGVLNLINVIKHFAPDAKLYQASTSELYGQNTTAPQNEETPFHPASPYAVAKLAAHWAVINHRKEGHFAACGILFNHESEVRGGNFVTRKITKKVASWEPFFKKGQFWDLNELIKIFDEKHHLQLGNLEARRDWGYAGDYVEAMYLMLQQDQPDDFVIGTGETHTVREFVEAAVRAIGKEIYWEGDGTGIIGRIDEVPVLRINPDFYRPVEVTLLRADPTKAMEKLGWKPKVTFEEVVKIMVEADR